VYTFVTEHSDSCNTVDVTYAVFFPFNYGKVQIIPELADPYNINT
jgi:hypothetical protein